jgi:uncharacterized membrane protein
MKKINKKAALFAAICTILSMVITVGLSYLSQLNSTIVNWLVLSLLISVIAFNFYQIFKLVYEEKTERVN